MSCARAWEWEKSLWFLIAKHTCTTSRCISSEKINPLELLIAFDWHTSRKIKKIKIPCLASVLYAAATVSCLSFGSPAGPPHLLAFISYHKQFKTLQYFYLCTILYFWPWYIFGKNHWSSSPKVVFRKNGSFHPQRLVLFDIWIELWGHNSCSRYVMSQKSLNDSPFVVSLLVVRHVKVSVMIWTNVTMIQHHSLAITHRQWTGYSERASWALPVRMLA